MTKIAIEEALSRHIKNAITNLSKTISTSLPLPFKLETELEIPKDLSFGDLTTNIAMKTARYFALDPVSIAEGIKEALSGSFEKEKFLNIIEKIEIAKPGYINFWFAKDFLNSNLKLIKRQNENYGKGNEGKGQKVQIEFVSANPTGPLTIAHGRQAAIGDALARILEFSGYKVHKEYFVNDEGRQIDVLGESILYHYLSFYNVDIKFPEDGYQGEYIKEIALEIKNKFGNRFVKDYSEKRQFFSRYGVEAILNDIKKDLLYFGVHFDAWFHQSDLSKSKIEMVFEMLRKKDYIYKKDGAIWFRATSFGDEKDRVVVKSDGSYTYLAPDMAYHLNKYRRGFKRIIDIWGPDHHGYIPRLKAAVKAMGFTEDSLSIRLVQLATLYMDGKLLSMSTRRGEFVTLREVMQEVGKDVSRFFFLMRKLDSHLDFDLELAKRQSQDNPVYYIQYAHARIWSIKDFKNKLGQKNKKAKPDPRRLNEKEELDLSRLLCQFPKYVRTSAEHLEPYYIIAYLNILSKFFHDFYTKHRVVTNDPVLTESRLYLIDCVRICLANGLRLLGVSLPKRM